ncbi:nuclear transport factor 2 family protein [Saliphagus infecundisoli]|uniref:Nuclear transport factor 2 family protein n=1 Tax=Saliphagus infecundisoli TaxID=1849069 RepID=A0ABD5QGX6_9EURY|nr:nuclear transport factor 2 family protein [Saliphagus infecundisoli]
MTGSADETDGAAGERVESAVREYYRAIDAGAYGDLEALLAPGFVQRRPDRTIEGRESFVRFMREDRPMTDTSHRLEEVIVADGQAVVRGELLDGDGESVFGFADVFSARGGRLVALETYTR